MTRLILASKSLTRAAILKNAGVAFETASPDVDERAVKTELLGGGAGPREIAEVLAERKAVAVSRQTAGMVIGADQTLDLAGALHDKAVTRAEARERLIALRGRTHLLHSGVVVAHRGAPVWRDLQTARLTMRAFSDAFLEAYLEREGEAALGSVGGYRLEGEGAQLFGQVDGDYFTILGLPLWGLLAFLRRSGVLPS